MHETFQTLEDNRVEPLYEVPWRLPLFYHDGASMLEQDVEGELNLIDKLIFTYTVAVPIFNKGDSIVLVSGEPYAVYF